MEHDSLEIITIKYHKEKPSNAKDVEDHYEWWTVEKGREFVQHLMPMHNAIYLNKEEANLLGRLAEAHQWKIKITR